MRQEFIIDEIGRFPVDMFTARKLCPWAARVVRVEGGYLCFETETDYLLWKHQQ